MKLNKEQILRIPGMVNKGMKANSIAEEFGVTPGAINYWVKRLRRDGFTVASKPGPAPLTFKKQ